MYRKLNYACALLILGVAFMSQPIFAGYSHEEGDLSGHFSFSAGGATVNARNINFGQGRLDMRHRDNRGSNATWQEFYVKPKVTFEYSLSAGLSTLAGGSVVAASTFGDGDAGGTTRSSDGRADVDEAFAGVRAGDWTLTAGRQNYIIGSGFIVMDGNLDMLGEGAYWLGPRAAFRNSLMLAWDRGPAQVQSFSLASDGHLGDFRMTGLNLDYDLDGAVVLGATAMKIGAPNGHSPARTPRDGMQVYNVRALQVKVPNIPALTLNGEYAVQRGNGDGVKYHADAWYAQADYLLKALPFTPILGYRFTHFSGDENLGDTRIKSWDALTRGVTDRSTWLLGDVVGSYLLFNSNENVHQYSIKSRLSDSLTLGAIHYQFSLDEKGHKGAEVKDRRFADETGVFLDWTPTPNLYTSLSYNWVNPKAAAKQIFGVDESFRTFQVFFIYRY